MELKNPRIRACEIARSICMLRCIHTYVTHTYTLTNPHTTHRTRVPKCTHICTNTRVHTRTRTHTQHTQDARTPPPPFQHHHHHHQYHHHHHHHQHHEHHHQGLLHSGTAAAVAGALPALCEPLLQAQLAHQQEKECRWEPLLAGSCV